ncbi:tbc1 domain family member related protein [Cyclospora cayetanensis]|uniref:Tbc1 domain family member related protein n=1 Tax=Cyclospora cayetanensis TaxID=88456 RepID=A0A1D3D075_9EIME|nr:tbc1 domain family member related protein [Cyclospora cayetanensis]
MQSGSTVFSLGAKGSAFELAKSCSRGQDMHLPSIHKRAAKPPLHASSETTWGKADSFSSRENEQPEGCYGIPKGDESMQALRRHVELLIDREINSKARTRYIASCCALFVPLSALFLYRIYRVYPMLETCLDALEPERLDPQLLRVICAKGLPEGCPALRSVYWRILLHCLPLEASKWQEHRRTLREAYESYKAEFIREPEAVRRLRRMQQEQQEKNRQKPQEGFTEELSSGSSPDGGASGCGKDSSIGSTAASDGVKTAQKASQSGDQRSNRSQSASSIAVAAVSDHPLCRSATSEWRGYWVDAEVFDQINKDVFRTRPELCFFAMNPQQTVMRQQQLHLYPPPPTRLAQPQHQQQSDEVPLLVNYYDLLQQQRQSQQQQGVSAALGDSVKGNSSSAHSGNGGNTGTTLSGTDSHQESSRKPSSSPLRGFRLPSAFRQKKSASTLTVSIGRLSSEDACSKGDVEAFKNASAIASSSASGSGRSFSASAAAGFGQQQAQAFDFSSGSLEDGEQWGKFSASVGVPFPYWINEAQQSSGASSHSKQAPDAADALEASAAAAQAARQLKRQLTSAKRSADAKPSHSSPTNVRSSPHDSLESDSVFSAGTIASCAPLPSPSRARTAQGSLGEGTLGEKLAPKQPVEATAEVAGTAVLAQQQSSGEGALTSSSPRVAEDTPVRDVSAHSKGEEGQTENPVSTEGKQDALQPWRAPAGVQDVCNMINPRRHYDVLSRLLFIYAKVNPGLCYVQGMNEILAPIYYTLMTDPTYTDYEQARELPKQPFGWPL